MQADEGTLACEGWMHCALQISDGILLLSRKSLVFRRFVVVSRLRLANTNLASVGGLLLTYLTADVFLDVWPSEVVFSDIPRE